MSNFIPRQGFKFAYNLYGKSEAQVLAFPADTNRNATAGEIFIGDAVGMLTTGFVTPFVSGLACVGVVVGISPSATPTVSLTITTAMNPAPPFNADALQQRSLPYNNSGWIYVIPAAGNAFVVLNTTASTLAVLGATSIAAGGCSVVGTAGTATTAATTHGTNFGAAGYTGWSNMAVDGTLTTTTDFRILGVSNMYVGGTNSNAGENDPASTLNQVIGIFKTPAFSN